MIILCLMTYVDERGVMVSKDYFRTMEESEGDLLQSSGGLERICGPFACFLYLKAPSLVFILPFAFAIQIILSYEE